jgi:hypothetical protein
MSLSGIKTTPTTDEVIQWFRPLDGEVRSLLESEANLNKKIVTSHMSSLTKYYDSNVATNWSTWKRLYADCLTDIGRHPMIDNKLNDMSVKFIIKSGKNETELNEMTKEEFVKLFALTMDKIIKDEETEQELRNKQQIEKEKEIMKKEMERVKDLEDREKEELASSRKYQTRNGSGSGSGGKSKKKSSKRNASKRRNRRTRNYKKK